jgi:hypothetical protein
MPRVLVFADENGNFDFSRKQGASKYFILTTVTVADCASGSSVLDLRRELAWQGHGLDREFHATTDPQLIRDAVFASLAPLPFRIDCTIIEKAKAQPHLRSSDDRFYQYAWFYHMRYLAPRILRANDELLVVSASVGVKKQRGIFHAAVRDVVQQVAPGGIPHRVAFWSAQSEPCLQVADYCAWAVQRKWEGGDPRSYDLVKGKIRSEFEIFRLGRVTYY